MASEQDLRTRYNLASFYNPVTMPGGYTFDHVRTLKLIDLYYNSQFEKGQYDSQGFRKYFYNVVKPACDVARKFIDLDTKDIMLLAQSPDEEEKIWVMQHDLRQWMKDNDFASKLNWVNENFPKYGSVVMKVGDGDVDGVYLHNLRFDIASRSLAESPYVYELSNMTARAIYEKPWDENAVKELLARGQAPNYIVYDCYDYNPNPSGKAWVHTVKADLFSYTKNGSFIRSTEAMLSTIGSQVLAMMVDPTKVVTGDSLVNNLAPSLTLYTEEKDDLPYRELHFEKLPGRWLGVGFVEYLFDNQIRRNEVVNVKAKALIHNGTKVYQTEDETVGRNILTDVENGDIIKSSKPITPVDNTERNLSYFDSEALDWDKNKIEKTFTTEVSRGENLPSRTPLGVANLQASMVSSYFELKRENFGIFLRKLILNDVIPMFKEFASKEHMLMFSGSEAEMDRLDHAIASAHVWAEAIKYAERNGFFPAQQDVQGQVQKVKGVMRQKKSRYLNIPDSFYDNAKYVVDVVITGEQLDTGALQSTLQTAMQIVGTNPAVLQDKGLRAIFFKMMELAGVSPVELDLMTQQINQAAQDNPQNPAAGQGGSVSQVPSGIANPTLIPKKQML